MSVLPYNEFNAFLKSNLSFKYSEKAKRFSKIFALLLTGMKKVRWRFWKTCGFRRIYEYNYILLNIDLGKESFYKNIFRLRHQNDFDSIVSLFLGVFKFWSVLIVKTDGKIDKIHHRELNLCRILRIFKSILNWTGAKML